MNNRNITVRHVMKLYACIEVACMYCTVKKHSSRHHDSVKQMATKHHNESQKITDPLEGMIKNFSEAYHNIER